MVWSREREALDRFRRPSDGKLCAPEMLVVCVNAEAAPAVVVPKIALENSSNSHYIQRQQAAANGLILNWLKLTIFECFHWPFTFVHSLPPPRFAGDWMLSWWMAGAAAIHSVQCVCVCVGQCRLSDWASFIGGNTLLAIHSLATAFDCRLTARWRACLLKQTNKQTLDE